MILKEDLEQLLKSYNINLPIEIKIRLQTTGNIENIKIILKKLIDEQNIDISDFEKYPTILLQDIKDIEEIIHIAKKRRMEITGAIFQTSADNFKRISTILKRNYILFTPTALSRTPEEVEEIISILKKEQVPIKSMVFNQTPEEIIRIISICQKHGIKLNNYLFQTTSQNLEDIIIFCEENNLILVNTMLHRTRTEIAEIINICNKEKIKTLDKMYKRTPQEVQEIISFCKENNMKITGSVFRKKPQTIKKIVSVCNELGIKQTKTVFHRTPKEIRQIVQIYHKLLQEKPNTNSFYQPPTEVEKTIKICLKSHIPVSDVFFHKKPSSLEETINFVKENYGKEYLLPHVLICNKDHIERIFSYLKGKKCLEIIKNNQDIMHLTLEEIVQREAIIKMLNEEFVVNGMLNPIFGLSNKKWQEEKTRYLNQILEQEDKNEKNSSTHNWK